MSRNTSANGLLTIEIAVNDSEREYNFSPTFDLSLVKDLLIRDRFEDSMVFLGPSNIPGAGDGLFAKRKIVQNSLVAFVNGQKIPTDMDYLRDLFAFDEVC